MKKTSRGRTRRPRPVAVRGKLDPFEGSRLVKARFQLADGTRMMGYLTPRRAPDNGLNSQQPVIVTADGQVFFWWGTLGPKPNDVRRLYRRLGKTSGAKVFPVRFASDLPLAGGEIAGEIQGFMVLRD